MKNDLTEVDKTATFGERHPARNVSNLEAEEPP